MSTLSSSMKKKFLTRLISNKRRFPQNKIEINSELFPTRAHKIRVTSMPACVRSPSVVKNATSAVAAILRARIEREINFL